MFRKIDDRTYASPQITVADVAEAKALGIAVIINNRPEDESDDQTPGAAIEAAARAAGIAYHAIPVTHAGFAAWQVEAMRKALDEAADAPSRFVERLGRNPSRIAAGAAGAGYDITPVRAQVDMLAAQAG